MNMIMSRAAHPVYPIRGTLSQLKPQISPCSDSPSDPSSPTSPLDFTDRIPFREIRLSRETLGSGSFGTVIKARWRHKDVAVKQFKSREEIDSFLVEVKQLSCARHKNIVKLYGASTLSDTAYLVMEYAEGGSLNHMLHENKLQEYDLRHACSWARQTAIGVAYLHSIRPKPIMHRDLKPANLLLFERGKILKICDFGTACTVKTQMTNNTGSAAYMAPEVFTTSSYFESGDIYSWSIIFWEILVRCHPYQQDFLSPFQILWAVKEGARPMVIEDCPEPIWNLITKCWDDRPKKRPKMKQVADEMDFIFSMTERRNRDTVRSPLTPETPIDERCFRGSTNPAKSFTTGVPSITSIHENQNSPKHRPSLPSTNYSQMERLSNARMTTSDYIFRNQDMSMASTSSSSSQQLELQSSYLSSERGHSTHRRRQVVDQKALQRRVAISMKQCRELEDRLKSDQKLTAEESFVMFEDLKGHIDSLRKLLKGETQPRRLD